MPSSEPQHSPARSTTEGIGFAGWQLTPAHRRRRRWRGWGKGGADDRRQPRGRRGHRAVILCAILLSGSRAPEPVAARP